MESSQPKHRNRYGLICLFEWGMSIDPDLHSASLYAYTGRNAAPGWHWNHHSTDVWNFANFNAENEFELYVMMQVK